MPISKIEVLSEIFETEIFFIRNIQERKSPLENFYNSHLQKFLNYVSPNTQLVLQNSKTINSDNYLKLLQEFSFNFTKLLNNDEFLSTYMILCQFELRKELACMFCSRIPRYKLLFDYLMKKELDEEINSMVIKPMIGKIMELCEVINSNLRIISVLNVKDEKFCKIESLLYELVIFNVNFKIRKFMFGKIVFNRKKFENGMIYFPKHCKQLVLLKTDGKIDPNISFHDKFEFGNEGNDVYSKYSIYKIIDLLMCEISYKEEGIGIKKKSKTITMKIGLQDKKLKIWNLMCQKRYMCPLRFRINGNRPFYDLQFNFSE